MPSAADKLVSRQPELVAPAGDEAALRAALSAGADAVYLGLDRWSARAFAGNFTVRDVVAAIDRAHLFGARAHLALNTLLKQEELQPALEALQAPYEAGLDALIVADLGFAALVRERFPELELHASTQLNTHAASQIDLLARWGLQRAIVARELSLEEIAALAGEGLELEVFVHGALCYGYSGLCLFSSMVGGRSGNRGRCSQACRMRYRLLRDARGTELERVLSTADLAAIAALPALLGAGVQAFKIEGRMKDARYVAVVTAVYREALDAALADPEGYVVQPDWWRRLEQSFSRGFTTAHLDALHSRVRSGGRGGHRGVAIGRVESVDDSSGLVTVKLSRPVSVGDVVCLYTPWGQSEPIRVPELPPRGEGLTQDGQRLVLRLRERAAVKDRLFRLSAAEADSFAQDLIASRSVLRPVRLHAILEGRIGGPALLRLTVIDRESDESSPRVSVESQALLQPAQTAALDEVKARAALGAFGGTPYSLDSLDYQVESGAFLPVAGLKDLRRRAVAELDGLRSAAWRRASSAARPLVALEAVSLPHRAADSPLPSLSTRPHAEAHVPVVLRLRLDEEPIVAPGVAVLCLDLSGHESPALVAARIGELSSSRLPVRCRPPEVLFDADHGWWRAVAGLPWQAVYARHAAHLQAGAPAILEYPLQGLNAELARRLRPAAVVASPEASRDEIAELAAVLGDEQPAMVVEALAFGRQQVLVTRDQLGLAEGLLGTEAESVAELTLVDGKEYAFPVSTTTAGTRIFNARLTNCAPFLAELEEAGVAAAVVVQADMLPAERRAFEAGGIIALGRFATRERSTSGHLFRGVL